MRAAWPRGWQSRQGFPGGHRATIAYELKAPLAPRDHAPERNGHSRAVGAVAAIWPRRPSTSSASRRLTEIRGPDRVAPGRCRRDAVMIPHGGIAG
jgi:hypothetical protein